MILCKQNAQNYMKRKATPLLWHAELAELYETQSDAKFASGRLLRFNFVECFAFLRILREVLSDLAPIKRLGKQFFVLLP